MRGHWTTGVVIELTKMFTPSPPPPPQKKAKNCKTIVFDFSNDNCITQEKFWTMVMQNFGGVNKGACENGEYWRMSSYNHFFSYRSLSLLESRLIWEKLSKFLRLIITVDKHAGRQKWPLRNYFCSFYPFELKVCKMEHTFPPVKSALLLLF